PDQFQCEPGTVCLPREWLCDGHPDCMDDGDERGCGTATPAEPSPDGVRVTPRQVSAVPPAGSAEPSADVRTRRGERISVCALSSPLLSSLALLSILVAVGSVAVWGLSKAKSRSDIFSPEKASREQLMLDKSQ
ncbi:RSVR protein, partial [Caloenas nicobarica]|nr:RSVR protein [Caloenas nicobarica]